MGRRCAACLCVARRGRGRRKSLNRNASCLAAPGGRAPQGRAGPQSMRRRTVHCQKFAPTAPTREWRCENGRVPSAQRTTAA